MLHNTHSFLFNEEDSHNKLESSIISHLPLTFHETIVFCIGSDCSTGDSYGPLVGTFLTETLSKEIPVYGSLENPIHALNLQYQLDEINCKHPNSFIIAIDAVLGPLKNVGHIKVNNCPIQPGAGVNNILPCVGNISITGIVNVLGLSNFSVLQNTRLFTVMNMARLTSLSLTNALHNYLSLKP